MKCNKCNEDLRLEKKKISETEKEIVYENIGYCDKCKIAYKISQSKKRKNGKKIYFTFCFIFLGILMCVSLVTFGIELYNKQPAIVCGIALLIFIIVCASIAESAIKPKIPKYTGTRPICPRCKKSHYHTMVTREVVIPGKTKTQSSLNLNPLKPFTVMNHKEKVVREEISREVTRFVCDECGNIWG